MVAKKWKILPHDVGLAESFERSIGVSPVVAQLLAIRGMTEIGPARDFVEAKLVGLRSPDSLPGVPLAADLILDAIRQQKKIAIYGDYDADGMTATAILWRCLKLLQADVFYYVPNRLDDGYGLNCAAIKSLADRDVDMIVSVDCGIASVKEVDFGNELNLSMIITDHHQPGPQLPKAAAIVHPGLDDYPFAGLCGAGVALKLAWAICQRACGQEKVTAEMRRFLMSALGLAAVGTVCDVVPLVDENRVIVRHGLINLKQTDIEGLRELIRLSELDSKPVLSAEDIGFRIGPRLNASGRLGQAQLGVELLTSSSRSRVNALAEYINNLNSSRDSIERRITKAANKQIKESFDPACEPALVLAEPDWHKGVIGIVAGRIAERYHRPTIVISIDPLRNQLAVGSGRSALGIDLYQALADCSELLESFGGHRAAAGLKIDPQHIEPFRERFYQAILSQANVVEMVPELQIDVETSLCQMTMDTIREIEKLAPFGQENPRPLLCASEVQLAAPPKRMGEGGRHLSLKLTQHDVRINAVAFGHGDWAEELEQSESGCFDFAFRPSINEFRGRRSVQLLIADWRESSLDRIDSTNGIPRSNPAATFDSAKT